jgi:hypothetical protein
MENDAYLPCVSSSIDIIPHLALCRAFGSECLWGKWRGFHYCREWLGSSFLNDGCSLHCTVYYTLHVAEMLPIFSGLNVWRWFPDASVNYALHAVKLPSTKEKL